MTISPLASGSTALYTPQIGENREATVRGRDASNDGDSDDGSRAVSGPVTNTNGQQVGQLINTTA